ncbi:hypothetical protein GDO86_000147 [Hymenochirus boettgeri]|uniref:HAUS augmin-like complex subunit 3 N-terminal domain-containing protein n=1 Tax=Hymenochirus boettgeri TaxID=247094 RepID=A0A8T2KGA3_9PIPI|nr:hypothetical protein GDO86_000147 [Hymenochirus boettgeri]
MSCGDRFVQTLRKLNYPKVFQLDGEDFDWLFEATDFRPFLDWFCSTVNEKNVVSDEKLQQFNSLKDSGKPILAEKALDEVLKTCKVSKSKTSAMEEVAMEKLEEDREALQKYKNLLIKRHNKLQMMATGNSQVCLKLKDKEEEDAKALQELHSLLQATNKMLNHELRGVIDGVQMLMSFYAIPKAGCELSFQPVFLSQVPLDNYLSREKQRTTALSLFTKEHFFEGMSKFIEGSEGNFELIQLNASDPSNSTALEDKCKEMMRLQLAYISTKHKLIQMKAKSVSLKVGLQWVEDNVLDQQNKVSQNEENLRSRTASLKTESSKIQHHINAIINEKLPCFVRDNAQLLNMPVVKGDYDLQIAQQNLYSSRQDLVCDYLMKQKSSFELLHLGYELELRRHRDVYRQLATLIQDLKQSNEKLEERLMKFSDEHLSFCSQPRTNIDSKDSASHSLYQLLDGDNTQKLFRTYDALESVTVKLTQDVASLKNQLAVSKQEQSLLLSKLDSGVTSLHGLMYPEGNVLVLTSPELSGQFYQLDSQLEKLNHVTVEILGDLQAKRQILGSNKLQQIEKQLYVYFFQNQDQLKSIVDKLESQTDSKLKA